MTPRPPSAPPAPRLRPGLHVVRRDDRHLQVGLDAPWRLVAPDGTDVQALLDDLTAGRSARPSTERAARVLTDLAAAGLLAQPSTPALGAVCLVGVGRLAQEAQHLLDQAGIATSDPPEAVVVLILSDGEPPRPLTDEQMREDRAHLVLAGDPGGYRIGPFVDPGHTACVRCVDAHRGDTDPRRGLVVEQLAGRPMAPDDPALRRLAIAWAVRDVQNHLEGRRPATWSASVAIGPDLEPRRTSWTRHPHCGCTWADGLAQA